MTREEFKELFDRNFDSVRSYIYYRCGDKEVATDIAQDVFMKVWEKKFDSKKGNIKGLLYKIASDMFISNYRRRETEGIFRKTIEINYYERSPEDSFEYNELKTKYEQALVAMNNNQRVVFLMSRVEELKYSEIAERLNLSVKAVEKRMKFALQFLRDRLNIEK